MLLSFFMEMSDVKISKLISKHRGTIGYHRKEALILLKKFMQERGVNNEN